MKKHFTIVLSAIAFLTLLGVSSCKRYYDPPPYFEDNTDTVAPSSRKVLIIGIDGAVGSEYKAIQAPILEGMKAHSKYAWDAVSDEVTTDAASWKTLISGVSYGRHSIGDSSFIYTQPPGADEHAVIKNYPSFFNYILSSSRPDLKTVFISPWSTMLNRLVPEVESKVLVDGDKAAKDSAVNRLQNTNPDVMVVHFNSPAIAGKTDAFSASSSAYKDAVLKVDTYIGDIMNALKSRPQYNKAEEWLVVITGTHGGNGDAYGGSTPAETNVFSFYYNENLKSAELTKDGILSSVTFSGRDNATVKAEAADPDLYDPGTGEQTVQVRMKSANAFNYPHFISKCDGFTSPGWTIFTNSNGIWCLSVKGVGSGEKRMQGAGPYKVFDNTWHTLTFVIYDSAGGRYVKRFTDGIRITNDGGGTNTLGGSYGTITSSQPLRLGWGADKGFGAVTFNAADLMVFNTALTDEEVAANLCLENVSNHPKYSNLIGYWPLDDGFGTKASNLAPGANTPLVYSGNFKWEGLNELTCNRPAITTEGKASLLVKSVDLVPTVFYWLRIPTKADWNLEGSPWIRDYEIEFVKL